MSESKKEKEFKEVEKKVDKFGLFTKQEDFLPTGYPLFDSYIAGFEEVQYDYSNNNLGFCRGKCYSFAGKNGIGKSTLILDIISRWILKGFSGIYQDVETGLNEDLLRKFGLFEFTAKTSEEFLNESKSFFVCSPSSFNESLTVLISMLKIRKFDFCVVDTFKQLLPDGDVEIYESEENQNGDGLMSGSRAESDYFPGLRRITQKFSIVTIGAQQVRVKKLPGFKPVFYEDEAGGNAFLHNMDARFMLKDKGAIEKMVTNNIGERESKRIGTHLELISKKNRFGMRFLHFTVIFGKGLSLLYLYKDILIASKNIVEKERGVHVFNISGVFGPEHPDFDEKLNGVKISNKDATLMAIKEKFDDIEKFVIDNKLMYIEKE